MRPFLLLLAAWLLAQPSDAEGQPVRPDLFACGQPPCSEGLATRFATIQCGPNPGLFLSGVLGRWVWGPVLCTGPISISLQTIAAPVTPSTTSAYPLFVEIRRDADAQTCFSWPGTIVMQTYGPSACDPDSLWESTTVNLPEFVPVGDVYWVQIEGFVTMGADGPPTAESPYFSCIQISPTTPVVPATWSRVKQLYGPAIH